MLHRRAQGVLDVAAVEPRNGLELVERYRHFSAPALRNPAGQCEDLLREAGYIAIRACCGEGERHLRFPCTGLVDAHLGADRREGLPQP